MKAIVAILGAAAAVVGGCATTRQTDVVPLEPGRTIRYTVPAALAGEMTDAALIEAFRQSLDRSSRLRPAQRETPSAPEKGVRTSAQGNAVTVAYLSHSSASLHHDFLATFDVKVNRNGGDVVLDVRCPDGMRVDYAGAGSLPYFPFVEPERAAVDLRSMCTRTALLIERREAGEVNVPFNDTSVYSNFRRKLTAVRDVSASVKQGDLEKFIWFQVPDGSRQRMVGVTVFPYRNGSKVNFVWLNRIICNPNATCDFDASAAQRVAAAVAAVAND